MPFSRQEIIVTKLVSGTLSILMTYVLMALFGIGLYYTYISHTIAASPYIIYDIARWFFLMAILVYLTIFFLMAMMFNLYWVTNLLQLLLRGLC